MRAIKKMEMSQYLCHQHLRSFTKETCGHLKLFFPLSFILSIFDQSICQVRYFAIEVQSFVDNTIERCAAFTQSDALFQKYEKKIEKDLVVYKKKFLGLLSFAIKGNGVGFSQRC